MNGAQHYQEAERLLREVEEESAPCGSAEHQCALAAAQVHATLALVAATAVARMTVPRHDGATATFIEDGVKWMEATS